MNNMISQKIRISLFLSILLIIGIEPLIGETVNGYYVKNTNDTVFTNFVLPNYKDESFLFFELQWSIKCKNDTTAEYLIKPDSVKEVRFEYKNKFEKILSRKNNFRTVLGEKKKPFVFLRIVKEGAINLFKGVILGQRTGGSAGSFQYGANGQVVSHSSGSIVPTGSSYPLNIYFLEDEAKVMHRLSAVGLKRKLKTYFARCPFLVEKIKKNEYWYDEIELMVHIYNYNCELSAPLPTK
ncbi:MAG: hypothetical protein IT236_15515 [Bacteroidia bacterium]|nr:hypothetical protein [Bacteroidia bacterium]